jgi:hypothetical protein
MDQIKVLVQEIENAERLGLSIAEVTEAKKLLKIEFAKIAFIVDQALKL